MLTVASGNFTFTSFSCPAANSLVYLVGTGGKPIAATSTTAAVTNNNFAMRSPAGSFGHDAPLNEPYGLAIDASGNLWLSNSGNNTLTELVGLAMPIHAPLLGPPAQP